MKRTRTAIARRIERPRINLAGRGKAIEAQRDLEVLLAAAVIEQAVFFRAIGPELTEMAAEAFRLAAPTLLPAGEWRVMNQTARLAERIMRLLAASRVLGGAQVREEIKGSAGFEPARLDGQATSLSHGLQFGELDNVGPARAVEYLRRLPVLSRQQWQAATEAARAQAFRIAGVNQEAALEGMRELVARSLEAGLTAEQFSKNARELLRNFETTAGKLRTIWNTNVGQALARGREEELRDPEVARFISWRQFDAMMDQFTRPNHAELENAVAPAWWWDGPGAEYKPLLGFNCRCTLIGITEARARQLIADGATDLSVDGVPMDAGPDAGFRRAA